jgi:hemerythrin superfamily protein
MPSRQNAHAQPADAMAMLKADHQRVKDLFAHYEATSNLDTKRTLVAQVFVELKTHAQFEENVFYPAVHEETDEGPALVKDSLSEHETVKHLRCHWIPTEMPLRAVFIRGRVQAPPAWTI